MILALDQGTTSSRALLINRAGQIVALAQKEFPQHYPHPGHVEHNPLDIWNSQFAAAKQVLAESNTAPQAIAAIGIANQRETTLLWDRKTGHPLHNAIVWQDRRTAEICDRLKTTGHEPLIQQKTGLVLDAYFSATKLQWLLDHIPHARTRAQNGELAFGTVDTWLLYNLMGKNVHATDPSNASRTLLFNLHTQTWDDDLLALFNIPRELLPEIRPTSSHFGQTTLFGHPVPITALVGDQQSALFGQTAFSPGLAKTTYGTGCFLLLNTGPTPISSKYKLLTTTAWSLSNSKPETGNSKLTYALEGSVFIGGAVVQWLRDGLGIIASAKDIEPLAASVPDSGGVYLVPAFAGLGAPHWDQYARGTITGLTRGTTKAHLARAALEAIAFQVADVVDTMQKDFGRPITELRVDGGAARNNLLLQFQSDFLQLPITRPTITESTASGAAYLAGLAAGVWKTPADLATLWKPDRTFTPQISSAQSAARRTRWNQALERAKSWDAPA